MFGKSFLNEGIQCFIRVVILPTLEASESKGQQPWREWIREKNRKQSEMLMEWSRRWGRLTLGFSFEVVYPNPLLL